MRRRGGLRRSAKTACCQILRDQLIAAAGAAVEIEEAREVHVHAGDEQPVGRHHVEGALARRDRGLRIDVRLHVDARPARLHVGHVHDVAPDEKLLALRCDHVAGVAGRVAVERHRGDAGKHLARRFAAAILIRHDLLARPAEEAHLLPLGRARHRGIVVPVRDVALRHHQLDMRIDRLAVRVGQPVGVIRMHVGEDDGVDLRRHRRRPPRCAWAYARASGPCCAASRYRPARCARRSG